MRKTLEIPDAVYEELEQRAAKDGATVDELVLRGAEMALGRLVARNQFGERIDPTKLGPVKRLTEPPIKGGAPGSLHLTNEMIDDLLHDS